jgi:hypothetical protein
MYSFYFASFRGSPDLEWTPCGPFYPHFVTLAVDKLCAKHARFKDVCLSKYLAYAYKTSSNNLVLIMAVLRK